MVLRSAVFMLTALFGVGRALEVAALRVSDVCISESASDVKISVLRRQNDHFGIGQMAHMVALPSRKGARPVLPLSGWLQFRGWLSAHRARLSRMSDPDSHTPLFVGFAGARFGLGIAAFVLSAA